MVSMYVQINLKKSNSYKAYPIISSSVGFKNRTVILFAERDNTSTPPAYHPVPRKNAWGMILSCGVKDTVMSFRLFAKTLSFEGMLA